MNLNYSEDDLKAVGKIQELKNCTVAKAKELFRKGVQKLANQDAPDRGEIVYANIVRGGGEEEAAPKPKRAPKKAAAKKSEKKAAKKAKPADAPKRIDVPLPELTRTVELKPVGEEFPHVHTATLFGKKAVVILSEIDHEKGAESRFGFVPVSRKRLDKAKEYALANDLPVAICAAVRLKGRIDQGYAVPLETFTKHMLESKHALTLSGKARADYGEFGWSGCKFSVAKSEAKAA